jgi:hypothetical protein
VIKGKGRPKGSKKKKKGEGKGSTRRDPSLFKHATINLPLAFDPPSNTTPPQLQTTIQNHLVANPVFTKSAIQRIAESHPGLSTTTIAVGTYTAFTPSIAFTSIPVRPDCRPCSKSYFRVLAGLLFGP